jgi:hypothetical protein
MTFRFVLPGQLQEDAEELLESFTPGREDSDRSISPGGFRVLLNGDAVAIPERVYFPINQIDSVIEYSEDEMRQLALCIGTRHHAGLFREDCVRRLEAIDQPWIIPFLVKLLGEYVIEIIEAVTELLPSADPVQLAAFVAENPAFMATTRRRAVSYWNCYYRTSFPKLQSYPGWIALDLIESIVDGVGGEAQRINPLTAKHHRALATAEPTSRGKVIDSLL